MAETGEDSLTAYRIKQVQRYVGSDEHFLLTYGDGVGNIDINAAVVAHKRSGKICTITAVHPPGRFGELALADDVSIVSFNEKPQTEGGYINGGYMVCNRELFDCLPDDADMMLKQAPLKDLAAAGRLGAYCHDGFWQPMDTFQEFGLLNKLWESGHALWKVWKDSNGVR